MPNMTIIKSSRQVDVVIALNELAPSGAHFTNGIYGLDASIIVPSMLAGFKYVADAYASPLPLIIAINSDESLHALGREGLKAQTQRAIQVAEPLSELFPERGVIVVFYDEATPFKLYQKLNEHNLTRTLHKWGYGTKESEPKVEGAEFFELVYGYPFPNDSKPLCYAQTALPSEEQPVIVRELRNTLIDDNNRLLFTLPLSLAAYQAAPTLQQPTLGHDIR